MRKVFRVLVQEVGDRVSVQSGIIPTIHYFFFLQESLGGFENDQQFIFEKLLTRTVWNDPTIFIFFNLNF